MRCVLGAVFVAFYGRLPHGCYGVRDAVGVFFYDVVCEREPGFFGGIDGVGFLLGAVGEIEVCLG